MDNPFRHHRVGGNIPVGSVDFPYQTTKQPCVWICNNEDCAEGKPTAAGIIPKFSFTADYPTCPKCKGSGHPFVVKRILIHMLVRDPGGAIQGATGRFSLACEPKRDFIATELNGEAGTGDPVVVNCPGCLKRITEEGLRQQGVHFRIDVTKEPEDSDPII